MYTLIFPGQGSEYIGMGKSFIDNFGNIANNILSDISDIVSIDIKKIMLHDSGDNFSSTINTQLATTALSVMVLEILRKEKGINFSNIKFSAGHSAGELVALYAANVCTLAQLIYMIKNRAAVMQDNIVDKPGCMAALLGFKSLLDVNELVEETREQQPNCFIANLNSSKQIVVGGDENAITLLSSIASSKKIKAIKLKTTGAFHTPFMNKASEAFYEVIKDMQFSKAKVDVIANVDALPYTDNASIIEKLVQQINSSVQWVNTIEYMHNNGAEQIIEVSNNVLTNMLKKETKYKFTVNSIKESDDLNHLN